MKAYAYVLPAGAEAIRDDINHSFVCTNRTDGFYVDIDNDCQVSYSTFMDEESRDRGGGDELYSIQTRSVF